MKIKLTLMAIAATLALNHSAKASASIGTTTAHSAFNAAIVVVTNAPSFVQNGNTIYKVANAKIGNKELLNLFAAWDETTWPTGAKLVVGWDWDGDILVVDSTGTNVLFDADWEDYAYFYIDWDDEDGAKQAVYNGANPGYDYWTELEASDWILYSDVGSAPYIYLWGDGGNVQSFQQSWDANGNWKSWTESETLTFPFQGDQYFIDSSWSRTSTKATFTTVGGGTGVNPFWYD